MHLSSLYNFTVDLKLLEIFVFRVPCKVPVKTSFGVMVDRPAVLLKVEDQDGFYGWGEVWCNFPNCGAEHRARLLEETISHLLLGKTFDSPNALFQYLNDKLRVLAIQTGEDGPISQVIAGIDIAVWDMVARRAKIPLYQIFGSKKNDLKLPVYASGINPDNPMEAVDRCREEGFRAFKLKIGFDNTLDLGNVATISQELSDREQFMVDANQSWDLSNAQRMIKEFETYPLSWLEEPLQADRPTEEWLALSTKSNIPLAVGENIRGEENFAIAISNKAFKVIQPDICKWGGFSGCYPVVKMTLDAGLKYCPHYLGGGIGLIASAHLLAAAGGNGLLEVDANENPLKEGLAQPYPKLKDGNFIFKPQSGLGVEPDLSQVKSFLQFHKKLLPENAYSRISNDCVSSF